MLSLVGGTIDTKNKGLANLAMPPGFKLMESCNMKEKFSLKNNVIDSQQNIISEKIYLNFFKHVDESKNKSTRKKKSANAQKTKRNKKIFSYNKLWMELLKL